MTPQEIHSQFKKVLDDLSEIDSSETFTQMLANNSFLIDDDDMGYLIFKVEEMLAAVKPFCPINSDEKRTATAAQDLENGAISIGFTPD
jgi:hypothetical protein